MEKNNKLLEKPLLGHGVVNPDYYVGKEEMVSFHNSFSDILVTYGIFGALIILFMIAYLLNKFNLKGSNYFIISLFAFIILSVLQPIFFNITVMSLLCILFLAKQSNTQDITFLKNKPKLQN